MQTAGGVIDGPSDGQVRARDVKGAAVRGFGSEFVEDQRQRLDERRFEAHRRPLDRPVRGSGAVLQKRVVDEFLQIDAAVGRPGHGGMRPDECAEAAVEALLEGFEVRAGVGGLAGDRTDDGRYVLHAVLQIPQQSIDRFSRGVHGRTPGRWRSPECGRRSLRCHRLPAGGRSRRRAGRDRPAARW